MMATIAAQQEDMVARIIAQALADVRARADAHEVSDRVYTVPADAVEAARHETRERLEQVCTEAVEAFRQTHR